MCWALNSHLFSCGKGWSSKWGLYTRYKDVPIKGGVTTPNIGSLDPGTYGQHGAVRDFRREGWVSLRET